MQLQFHPHLNRAASALLPFALCPLSAQLEEMVRLHAESAPSTEAAAPAAAGGHYQKPKMQQAYGKAIESIAKYPLPITSAEEAEELQGSQTTRGSRSGMNALQLRIRRAC